MAKIENKVGPRDFARTLAELSDGDLNVQMGVEQQRLLEILHEQALAGGKTYKSKGAITLTLKYEVQGNGVVSIDPSVKVTAPKQPMAKTVRYVDENGNLAVTDPRQGQLNLREVPGPGAARDVLANG
jgi:hypothetical protein